VDGKSGIFRNLFLIGEKPFFTLWGLWEGGLKKVQGRRYKPPRGLKPPHRGGETAGKKAPR